MSKRILISYSAKDESLRAELATHLAPLRDACILTAWFERDLLPGAEGPASLHQALESADIVVLLVSADFLASGDCGARVRRAMERYVADGVHVVPVLLRPCHWEVAAFAALKPLPSSRTPITQWTNRDEAWFDVVSGLKDVATGQSPRAGSATAGDTGPSTARASTSPPSAQVDDWIRDLEHAHAKKAALFSTGGDTAAVNATIQERKNQLRAGGQLRANDSLGDGRYFLLRELGRGRLATVWEADDRKTGTRVAIKVLHPHLAAEPAFRTRFFRGAQRMEKLSHENIVRVLVPYEEDDDFCYFVMDLVKGKNLHAEVMEGRVPPERAISLILQAGEALATAHAAGLLHEALSPHNILVDDAGPARLLDFSLIDAKDAGDESKGATDRLEYVAPEALSSPRPVDARADVFSLGMTALFCFDRSDRSAFASRDPSKALASMTSDAIARVLRRATARDPQERYVSVPALCNALRLASAARSSTQGSLPPVASPIPPVASPVSAASLVLDSWPPATSSKPPSKRWRWSSIPVTPIVIGLFAAAVALAVMTLVHATSPPSPAPAGDPDKPRLFPPLRIDATTDPPVVTPTPQIDSLQATASSTAPPVAPTAAPPPRTSASSTSAPADPSSPAPFQTSTSSTSAPADSTSPVPSQSSTSTAPPPAGSSSPASPRTSPSAAAPPIGTL